MMRIGQHRAGLFPTYRNLDNGGIVEEGSARTFVTIGMGQQQEEAEGTVASFGINLRVRMVVGVCGQGARCAGRVAL